jgi:hypothetical protein
MRATHTHCVLSRGISQAHHLMVSYLKAVSLLSLSGACSNLSTYFSQIFHQNLFNMKRMSFQLSVKALLVAFFMIGGFVAVTETSAQSGSLTGTSVSTVANYLDADQATIKLMDQIAFYHSVLPGYAPGSASYYYAYRRAAYYKEIVALIAGGSTVPSAISNGLGAAATLRGEKEASFTTKVELNTVYTETIALLTL